MLNATVDYYRFGPDDAWTLFHSVAFDFSVWEMYGALCFGGKLVIVPYFVARSPPDYRALLIKEKVTFVNQPPSAWNQLTAH